MSAFLAITGLMALAAIGIVLWPLLRSTGASAPRWPAAIAAAVLIPGLAYGLYQTWSNWSWSPAADMPGVPPPVAQMVGRLEARLRANPNDINGWLLLGRSYFELGQYLKAADAYERAYTQSGGENLDAMLGLGETLVFADERAVTPRSAQLFERAYQRAPNDPRALWYSGLAAFQEGRLDIARARWQGLVALNPPPEIKRVLESKIAELDAQLGTRGPAPAASANAPVVKVRVLLDPKLSDRVPQGAPLFVMVRAGEGGGPPLAVTRRDAAQFPLLVELSDRDSMIAGRSLADAASLTVVARIARSGDPRARSGDLEGKVGYDVKQREPVDLTIDSIVP